MNLLKMQKAIHKTAVEHGWWETDCDNCLGLGETGDPKDKLYSVECPDCNGKGKVPLKRNFGEVIALMHSELSEALEEFRDGREMNEIYFPNIQNEGLRGAKPEGIPIEMADCIIRILDWAESEGVDMEEAIRIKMDYNNTRPYRHGRKAGN